MFTLIKILIVLAVIVSIVGFITGAFGLVRSFMLDRFNRFVYLGLAVICAGAIIGGLAFGVSYLHIRSVVNDINQAQAQPTYDDAAEETSEPAVDEIVEGDNDLEDTSELGAEGFVYPEDLTEEAMTQSNGSYNALCIQSDNASKFFYATTGSESYGDSYLVPVSPFEVYVVSPTDDGPAILYVNTDEYVVASANETAYEYSYLVGPEEFGVGLDPIDTDSEAFQAAEGCIS